MRLSIFQNDQPRTLPEGSLILRSDDLDALLDALAKAGVAPEGGVREALGFMRHATLRDPSGNFVSIAQYLRDPLAVA